MFSLYLIQLECSFSTRAKKYFLCLVCGPASVNSAIPKAKLGMEEDDSGSEVDSSDEEQQTVSISSSSRDGVRLGIELSTSAS